MNSELSHQWLIAASAAWVIAVNPTAVFRLSKGLGPVKLRPQDGVCLPSLSERHGSKKEIKGIALVKFRPGRLEERNRLSAE